jgi:membrane protein YqaA with SNARE-associated domain
MRADRALARIEAATCAMESKHGRGHRTRLYVAPRNLGPAMLDSLYSRLTVLAQGPRAEAALAAVAFAESSFFPIPPDVLLAPMALAKPARAWRYALIATIASVLGGMLGYAIGAVLYDTLGQWLVNLYGYGAKMEALKQTYATWGWLVILVKGVTPIPYKLVTITSGLLGYNFALFVALSVVTRGARFFLVAGALRWLGEPLRAAMERNFAAVLGGFAALVVAGFVIAIKVF